MNKQNITLVLTFFLLSLTRVSGQNNLPVITLKDPQSGNQNYIARDKIKMLPGFKYKAEQGNTMIAKINNELVCETSYNNPETGKPYSREFSTALPVGSTSGTIDVTPTGAATYSIPIFVSPGTAGMQPSISIVYNSQGGNGLLGIGWDIGGLSSISRTPKTVYHDGMADGIDLQYTDRFAMDGNRLIAPTSDYGLNGTVYGTEVETFSKITSNGTAGNGPEWFKVETKNGDILEYGNTPDSRVEPHGNTTPLIWRLNRATDPYGNYVKYTYWEEYGESFIRQIDYTGTTSFQPYNTIKFIYEKRTDKNILYIAGAELPQTVLLHAIRVESEGQLVKEYKFIYSLDPINTNLNTHLAEVVEYGSDGSHLNSTVINWGAITSIIKRLTTNYVRSTLHEKFFGDFNGDGRTDFIDITRTDATVDWQNWHLFLKNTDENTFTQKGEGTLNSNFLGFYIADINNDGKDDIFWKEKEHITYNCNCRPCSNPPGELEQHRDSISIEVPDSITIFAANSNSLDGVSNNPTVPDQTECCDGCYYDQIAFKFYYFNGTSLTRGESYKDINLFWYSSTTQLLPGDFDGNGSTDFLIIDENKNIKNLIGLSLTPIPNLDNPNKLELVDFNGDGRTDIMVIKDELCTIYQYNSTNQALEVLYSSGFPTKWHTLFPGDFNGDGKTDLLFYNSSVGWKLQFSTGSGFSWPMITVPLKNADPNTSTTDNNYFIQDLNGDGRSDIFELYDNWNGGTWQGASFIVHYSQGNGNFINETQIYRDNIWEKCFSFGDFNGDGKKDILYDNPSGYPHDIIYFHKDEQQNLVQTITNGFNQKTQISYEPLTTYSGCYTNGSGAIFPINDFKGAFYVVKKLSTPSISGADLPISYFYTGAKVHKQGKGFLGFSNIKSLDFRTGFTAINTYEINNIFYNPSLKKNEVLSADGSPVSEVTNTNSVTDLGNKRFFPFVSQTISVDKLKSITTTSDYTYDMYGNLTASNVRTGGEVTSTTTNVYTKAGGWEPLNRLSKATVWVKYGGQPSYERVIQYLYNDKGGLTKKISDPGKAKQVTTSYTLNSLGLSTMTSISAGDIASRVISYSYDQKYRFIEITTNNPYSNSLVQRYDPRTGNMTEETGIDGNKTTYTYDGFGRIKTLQAPQSSPITYEYNWSIGNGPFGSLYYICKSSFSRPTIKNYFDAFGGKLRSQTLGFNGLVNVDQEYDERGNVVKKSLPNYDGTNPTQNTYIYDNYGRVISQTADGLTTTFLYLTNSVKTTHPDGKETTQTFDVMGNLLSATDKKGGIVNYIYGSHGKPIEVNSEGTKIEFKYDEYGIQTKIIDPNAGIVNYDYNSLGELTSQENPKGKTSLVLDCFGRVTTKTNTEGTTTYNYNYNGYGIGQVASIIGPNNTEIWYEYDKYGNRTKLTEKIQGQNYITGYTYNDYGDVTQITYPSGFGLTRLYNNGFLTEIKRSDNQNTIWKRQSETALGQPLLYSQGNNLFSTTYTYDSHNAITGIKAGTNQEFAYDINHTTGNMNWRKDSKRNLTEVFGYDELNRLETVTFNGQPTQSMSYSPNGNIQSKSDAGNYKYHDFKVNAVDTILNNPKTLPVHVQNVNYNSFNKAFEITTGNNKLNLTYGVDEERVKTEQYENGILKVTKIFATSYEKEIKNGVTREIHYISGVYGLEAIYIKEGGKDGMYYVCKDHLGSITALVNESGSIAEEYSYDTWGRRRNPIDWTYANVASPSIIDRGFTGHEHLAEFELINMNGRMYDPIVSRFLSPDNFVQLPDFTQNLNRYSYCLNNPLVYTDPNGNFIWAPVIVGAMVGAFINGMRTEMRGGNWWDGYWKGALVGAAGGALAQVGGGYYISNALWGTAQGAITGGLSAALNGENIGRGIFWGAAAGFAFATLTSGMECYRNSRDGYGFYTNKGAINKLVTARNYQKSFEFMEKRYGFTHTNLGDKINYEITNDIETSAEFDPKTSTIRMRPSTFDNTNKFLSNYTHEIGHSQTVDIIQDFQELDELSKPIYNEIKYCKADGWGSEFNSAKMPIWQREIMLKDGPYGFTSELKMMGRLQYFNQLKYNYISPVYGLKRYLYAIPQRF